VTRASRRDLNIAFAALVVAALAAVVVVVVGVQRTENKSPTARGEAIFQSGVDADGMPIPRAESQSGGGGMMGGGVMGGGMMRLSCASCHGSDGHGRSTQQFTSPNITYSNLTDPEGMLMPDSSRGTVYTDAAIRTAVTTGVDPSGAHLEAPMPQWQLSDQQWADLLAYLKTLH